MGINIEYSNQELPEYIQIAENLKTKSTNLNELMGEIRKSLHKHYQKRPTITHTKSLLESRLTPTEKQYDMNMATCGAQVNIETDMLRAMGYEVKKVHGEIDGVSKEHAWIKVLDNANNEWGYWDLTQKNMKPGDNHRIIAECNEWDEILKT